jgi:FkbM family methyltransferase
MQNSDYLHKLARSIAHNENRDWACYFRRLGILPAILMQKMGFNKLVRVPVFYGDKMHVITDEIVSRQLIAFGFSEPEIIALMLTKLQEGDTFVDVGTHYGFEAMVGSKVVGKSGRVVAFEPNPGSFKIARMNLTGDNVSLNNLAVGDYEGVVNMNAYDIYSSAMNSVTNDSSFVDNPWVRSKEGKVIEVKLTTLDVFLNDRTRPVNFIKCDVEGFEVNVIKGALKVITKDKPLIVLESDYRPDGKTTGRLQGLISLMETLDYSPYDFDFKNGALIIGRIGMVIVGHPNVLFMPNNN